MRKLKSPKSPRILLLDTETSPIISYTWGEYEVNVIKVIKPWHLLSFAYKWLGDRVTQVEANSPKTPTNDLNLSKSLRYILDEADVVIAQNGDSFDIPKINTRLLIHKLSPPSPYRTIDTLKVAKTKFAFSSNKLDSIGRSLDEGEKLKHRGFEMWEGCLAGDVKSWADMRRYNKQDVDLLERIYLRFRPWISNHPNLAAYDHGTTCPKCGSDRLQHRGYAMGQTRKYRKLQCQTCGGWCQMLTGQKVAYVKGV